MAEVRRAVGVKEQWDRPSTSHEAETGEAGVGERDHSGGARCGRRGVGVRARGGSRVERPLPLAVACLFAS